MKIRIILFVLCFSGLSFTVSAQEYAIDKYATIISGSGSFMSKGGVLFEDIDGNNSTNFTFAPNINHFITKNFFIGGGFEFSTESQGDYKAYGKGIGPQIGYAFGGPESTVFPYLDLGIRYYILNYDNGPGDYLRVSGSDISLGFGVIIPVKAHIGLIFEGGYHMLDLSDKENNDSYSGNIFSVGVGISGLLFKDAK